MPQRTATSYFELGAPPFGFAVRTSEVLRVLHEAPLDRPVVALEHSLQVVHLAALFATPTAARLGSTAAFALLVESPSGPAALGIEHVGHLSAPQVPALARLPGFGLRHATLFEGVLRMPNRLLLVFNIGELVTFMAQRMHREFA